MAQTRNQRQGKAKDAPMSVALNFHPDADHHADLVAYLTGRQNVTVRSKTGTSVRGWAPGADMNELPEMLTVCAGCVARIVIDQPPAVHQDAGIVALMVAKGQLDIVDAKEFDKARPHKELHAELRKKDMERQARKMGSDASLEARITALEVENAKLRKTAAA